MVNFLKCFLSLHNLLMRLSTFLRCWNTEFLNFPKTVPIWSKISKARTDLVKLEDLINCKMKQLKN